MSAETSPFAKAASLATFPAAPGATDYDAIFAAVMETDRGRWFLSEYARRNRQADTAEVLAAIDRLSAMTRSGLVDQRPDRAQRDQSSADVRCLRIELADMANAIARTKNEIAPIRPDTAQHGRVMEAAEQLDSVVRTTSDILAAAKQIQDVAWTMREQGMDLEFCTSSIDMPPKFAQPAHSRT